VYAFLEKVRYNGCIWNMFTQIQMHHSYAIVNRAVLKKIILDQLPYIILEQLHTVDLIGTTDNEIISIIKNAERTAEKWKEDTRNLGLRKPNLEVQQGAQRRSLFGKVTWFDKPKAVKNQLEGRHNNNKSEGKLKSRNMSKET
jgi:hypothetical protein